MRVVVVGGGVIGAATACFLARDHGAVVTVLERDPTGARASSALSASSIRQQFTQPANIALSRWSLGFLQRVGEELAVAGELPPSIGLVLPGYLYLAAPEGAAALRASHALQRAHGAPIELLDAQALRIRFPWLRTGDLALATLGAGCEGWFDGPALWQAFRRKAIACGARWVEAEATDFDAAGGRVRAVVMAGGERVAADAFVIAAGAWSAALAARLGFALPVAPRKRDVFVLESPARLPGCPLIVDPSGVWLRPEGSGFIAGAPPRGGDPDEPPLEAIDHDLFERRIWPVLAHRLEGFEALRVRSAWAGYYEVNDFDHNGIAGALPGWVNAYAACGFSGHGMQQAPAVGCAIAALLSGPSVASTPPPDIGALTPARIAAGQPLREGNVI